MRDQLKRVMSPLPIWYPTATVENEDDYPLHALTQRPMAMYHSWGSQNAWLRQIHGMNPMYLPTKVMQEQGLVDGDWAKVSSPNGEITVPVAEMAALNENTIWTWNAIGKRRGAWALDPEAPEANKGFFLNHLISELCRPKGTDFVGQTLIRSRDRPRGLTCACALKNIPTKRHAATV